jgi:nucleoside-diphosphate-sugar epimerase
MTEIEKLDIRDSIANPESLILVTGATGFIGSKLVERLLEHGFRNVRCLVRPSSKVARLAALTQAYESAHIEVVEGNLLSREDCTAVAKDATVIFHLAAGRGEKSYPDAFLNSVVTTRNLLEACAGNNYLRRFVSISSFSVYSNSGKQKWRLLDETCPIEKQPERRGEAYCFAKVKQDEIVVEYGNKLAIPYVIVRPGYVYGPGNLSITGRVGIDTFGVFLNLGGSNPVALTYVDNCVDAIMLAGLRKGIEKQVFNIVDDDLPSGRKFLRLYKKNVRRFTSLYVPHAVSYMFCYLWEAYSDWSKGQMALAFNRRKWHAFWKMTHFSNKKAKTYLGWSPRVPAKEALNRYFAACLEAKPHA